MTCSGDFNSHLLDGIHKLHFIGIGGSGMFPLVQILTARGYEIGGSDVSESSITASERAMGVTVYIGHDPAHIEGAQMVVYSAAIHEDNPELSAARAHGLPCVERSVLLGYVSRLYRNSVCVAGTHGKTTVTSMITTMLELAGRDPAAVIGGKLPLIGGYGKAGGGQTIVVEACEFAGTFLKLTPSISILLNIDNDHLDYYGTMGKLMMAFQTFALMATNMVVANADDPNTLAVVNSIDRDVRTFGIQNGDYTAENIREYKPGFFEFDVLEWGGHFTHIRLGVPGRHNIYNALAMCACVRALDLEPADAATAAEHFTGAARRFEVMGEVNGATVVDDYGHHPTELEATLKTARGLGYKKVWAVHQPFTYSRTKLLMEDFVRVLSLADHVVLTPIMGSREVDDGTVKSEDLAAKIPGAVTVGSLEEAADYVRAHAQPGELILTMGCGNINRVANMLVGK